MKNEKLTFTFNDPLVVRGKGGRVIIQKRRRGLTMNKLFFMAVILGFFLFIGYTTHLWIDAMPSVPVSSELMGHIMYIKNSR